MFFLGNIELLFFLPYIYLFEGLMCKFFMVPNEYKWKAEVKGAWWLQTTTNNSVPEDIWVSTDVLTVSRSEAFLEEYM
jgi:hypothetical protein